VPHSSRLQPLNAQSLEKPARDKNILAYSKHMKIMDLLSFIKLSSCVNVIKLSFFSLLNKLERLSMERFFPVGPIFICSILLL
jgi:hypothetical protein